MKQLLLRLFGARKRPRSGRSGCAVPRHFRPAVESLEDRSLPSVANLVGLDVYLNTAAGTAPQKLAVTSENTATGAYGGTWTDGVTGRQVPVSGQIKTDLSSYDVTASGSDVVRFERVPLGETVSFAGNVGLAGARGQLSESWSNLAARGSLSAAVAGIGQMGVNLGDEAVLWGFGRLGQEVGAGQCTDFVNQALGAVGAKEIGNAPNGPYTWGALQAAYVPGATPPSAYNSVKPGEVLQIWNSSAYGYANIVHTAIVVANEGNGRLLVLDQNDPYGNAKVTLNTIDLSQYFGGQACFYLPVRA